MLKKWLHAVVVLPDGRILLERMTFNQIGYTPPKKGKWVVSVGVQNWAEHDPNVTPGIHSKEIETLAKIIFRRLGIKILDTPGVQVLHLLSHKLRKNATGGMFHMVKTMEVFRVKAFNNIELRLDNNSEIKAMFKEEIISNLGSGMFTEESITTINMIRAMHVNL